MQSYNFYFKQNGTKAVFGDAYNFLTTKEKDEKSRFILFFSPHPNLVTVLTHRADGGFLVAIYLLNSKEAAVRLRLLM